MNKNILSSATCGMNILLIYVPVVLRVLLQAAQDGVLQMLLYEGLLVLLGCMASLCWLLSSAALEPGILQRSRLTRTRLTLC